MDASRSFELDDVDWRASACSASSSRQSFNALSKRVHLSPPAVAERVRRLEAAGVISGYRAVVDPARAGQPLLAFIQLRCSLGRCLLKTTTAQTYPEVVEIHKLSGEHCTMLKLRAASLGHLEGVIERIGEHGQINTYVVLSTAYEGRPVTAVSPDRPVTRSEGWSRDA